MRILILLAVASSFACSSCQDVDKKGDPFDTTEDAGDAGDDTGGGTDGGPRDMGGPDDMAPGVPNLGVEPGSLVFLDVPVGATAEQTVTVRNAGAGTLEISSITLVETSTDDPGGVEFSTGAQWSSTAALAAGETLTLAVQYSPRDDASDAGYIELRTNDPDLIDGIARVSMTSLAAVPDIAVQQAVIFQRVPPVDVNTRDEYWEVIEVRNVGGARLEVDDVVVSPVGAPFTFSFPQAVGSPPSTDADSPPSGIEPGGSMPVRIFFNPTDTLPQSAELILFTNDPDSPQTPVQLTGNSGSPCIQLSEETRIDFGMGAVGFTSNRTLIVENCSNTAPLQVGSFEVCMNDANGTCSTPGVFGVNVGTLGASGQILPGDTATLVLSFAPTDLTLYTGRFSIDSDDPARPTVEVPLRGEGTDGNACPQAVADGRITGSTAYTTNVNALPLQTIELRGTNSTDPDGSVASYLWTIVQRPVNSTTVLTPSNDVASPQLFIDLAGTYLLELQVTDDDGAISCGTQALVRIDAVPGEDIHVQLVWDTPADSNQTDANGTDLDLHFLHPNGTWNNAPWDIFWLNPTSEWGVPGPMDDPSLDIDDTDGSGPENINLNDPQAGLNYAVGAYYYSDNGFGPSYATIRIYVDGVLAYEYRDLFMQNTGMFWHAANVSWPTGNVTGVNQVTTGFP